MLHTIAYLVFLGTVVGFFSPIFFQGKKLFAGDIPHHEGIAQQLLDYRKLTGDEPLWSNAVFSGMPAYLIDVQYQEPLNTLLRGLIAGFLPRNVGHIFTAMIMCYVLLLSFGIYPYVAIAGGMAYGLSTFTLVSIGIGHDGKVAAMAWIPLVLAGVHIAYHQHRWWGTVLSALGLSLELAATHPQITYYLGLLLFMYIINQLILSIQEKKLNSFFHTSMALSIAVLLGIGANFGRLWNIYEYNPYSIRGSSELQTTKELSSAGLDKDYAFRWSLGKLETLTLLIPNFYGGSSDEQLHRDSYVNKVLQNHGFRQPQIDLYLQHIPTYWGDQPFTLGPMYLGAITVFLCLAGFCGGVEKKYRYWLLASTVLGIILAWGKHWAIFNDWMYYYFPGYNKFRAVTTAIVMPQVATVLLGCLTLQRLLDQGITPAIRKGLRYAAIIMSGILFLSLAFAFWSKYEAPGDVSLPPWLFQALRSDRKAMLQKDILRSLLFILAMGMILVGYGWKRVRVNQVAIGLMLLMLADYYGVGKRYVRSTSYQTQDKINALDAVPARKYIQQDTTLGYRVFNLNNPFNDGRTSYYHQSVGGYHGAKLQRYQDLIEHCIVDEYAQIMSYKKNSIDSLPHLPVLNMLNTRYFVASSQQTGVITNPGALGNAWFVQSIHPVGSPLEEINALKKIYPQHTAVIDTTQFAFPQTFLGEGKLNLTVYRPNYLVYAAEALTDGLAVFSEVYYPKGWQARLDGQAVNHIRVNYILRALVVPAGKHTITFSFAPKSYQTGNKVMLATAILMIMLLVIGGMYKARGWILRYLPKIARK